MPLTMPLARLLGLALLALFLSLAAPPVRAEEEDFATSLQALASDNFADKAAAVQSLIPSRDPRAAPLLAALADNRLLLRPDGGLALERGDALIDPASGQSLADLKAADLSPVTINNRLRGLLHALTASLDLTSPDAALRLHAVEQVAAQPSAAAAEPLRAALAQERNAKIRALMQTTLAGLDLASDDAARRLEAVHLLAESSDRTALGQLTRLLDQEQDAGVRQAADKVAASIRTRLTLIDIAANLFQGLSLGSVLLLAAIGLAITFGVMGVINMAHGEMIMLGSYTTYVVQEGFRAYLPPGWIDAYLIAALPIAFLVTGLIGMALERGVIRFLYGRPLETLLATWGLSLVLQQAVRTVFGPTNQEVSNPSWMSGAFEIGQITITYNRLWILCFTLAVFAILLAMLRYTALGLEMRAVTQNRRMAASMGIATSRVDALTFGLGSGIAGIAGVALSQIDNVSPNLGQSYIIDSFMVVVFGGVGNLWGTLVGAFTLGIANKFLEPVAGAVLAKIAILVLIILFIQKRPRGLFALKGRAVEA